MAGNVAHENAFFPIRYAWIFVFGTQFFEIHRTWKKKECSIVPNKRLGTIRKPDGTMKYHTQGYTTKRLKNTESVVTIISATGKIRKSHPAVFPVGLPEE